MKNIEVWHSINNNYQVSNFGNIKSLPRKGTKGGLVKYNIKKTGYNEVYVGSFKLLHRLVAEAFIPNPNNKPCVDHIDHNKSNNCVSNLRWVTYEENNKHRYDCGRANQWTLYGVKNKPQLL